MTIPLRSNLLKPLFETVNARSLINSECKFPYINLLDASIKIPTAHVPEAYLEPSRTSMMQLFCKLFTVFAIKHHCNCLTEF